MWQQTYDPLGSSVASTLVAAVPIVLLLVMLGVLHVRAHLAALAGLGAAMAVAAFAYGMPAGPLLGAAGYGAAFGLLPIGWILVAALFLYNLTVETGRFEIVKHSVAGLSPDRRVQVVLIAFCFGAFLEGAAGFGFPVAICGALLIGLGFPPLQAAVLALIANTSPVAFGSLGVPIKTLAQVTAGDPSQVDAWADVYARMAGRQLPFFSLLVPVWLVAVMGGLRALRGMWPAMLTAGGSFALFQHLLAEHLGPSLVDVLAGIASLVSMAVLLRFWQPSPNPDFLPAPAGTEPGTPAADAAAAPPPSPPLARGAETEPRSGDLSAGGSPDHSAKGSPDLSAGGSRPPLAGYGGWAVAEAWTPWLLLSGVVLLWSVPAVKGGLEKQTLSWEVPGLHNVVASGPEVRGGKPAEAALQAAVFKLNWLSATGTALLLATVPAALLMRVRLRRYFEIFGRTVVQLRWSLLTIVAMLALGNVTKYSGQDVTLGLAFTATGAAYPFFSALLGWLGVALTGSDTSSNVLFGNLQKITGAGLSAAGVLPMDAGHAQVLLCTANSTGGVMGKMIDAQSIVVAAAATGRERDAGAILRSVFPHSIILAALVGLLVLVQAYWWTAAIPSPP